MAARAQLGGRGFCLLLRGGDDEACAEDHRWASVPVAHCATICLAAEAMAEKAAPPAACVRVSSLHPGRRERRRAGGPFRCGAADAVHGLRGLVPREDGAAGARVSGSCSSGSSSRGLGQAPAHPAVGLRHIRAAGRCHFELPSTVASVETFPPPRFPSLTGHGDQFELLQAIARAAHLPLRHARLGRNGPLVWPALLARCRRAWPARSTRRARRA